METCRDLNAYLSQGAKRVAGEILRGVLRNPKEAAFLRRFRRRQPILERRRLLHAAQGLSIPMFLIASVTGSCNLSCKGCYARANGLCSQRDDQGQLDAGQWGGIFSQAAQAGIPFVLLAGGEPFLKPEVLRAAAGQEEILFPIFTNGTLLNQEMLALLSDHRNLVPVVSLEGGADATDERRGEGTYALARKALAELHALGLLFGTSLTVTTENLKEVSAPGFIGELYEAGCRLVFLIEYVPVTPGTEYLAPGDTERLQLETAQEALRARFPGMIFLSFPGDEKYLGGCLAAGRGFFHINPYGGAEPCPFSPISAMSLKDHTLLEALASPFFQRVRELNAKDKGHAGGCALFDKEAQVRGLLRGL